MNNKVETFKHEVFGNLEVFDVGGTSMFYGKFVAELLGYSNPNKAVRDHVDEDDKAGTKRSTLGGDQEIVVINESGLYCLIIKSKLPMAKSFKRWVTSEVLPSIRKHGGYLSGQEEMTPEELMAKAVLMAQSKIDELNGVVKEKDELLSDKNFPISLTKMFSGNNKIAQGANLWLENEGLIEKSFERGIKKGWKLTEEGEKNGMGSQTGTHQVFWTPKILKLLPSQKELLAFANSMGLVNWKKA